MRDEGWLLLAGTPKTMFFRSRTHAPIPPFVVGGDANNGQETS